MDPNKSVDNTHLHECSLYRRHRCSCWRYLLKQHHQDQNRTRGRPGWGRTADVMHSDCMLRGQHAKSPTSNPLSSVCVCVCEIKTKNLLSRVWLASQPNLGMLWVIFSSFHVLNTRLSSHWVGSMHAATVNTLQYSSLNYFFIMKL